MLQTSQIDPLVKLALKEDVGSRDITTSSIIPKNLSVKADIEFKQSGVLCGIQIAERVFRLTDENLRFLPVARDGERIEKNREVAYLEGSAAALLIAERTALNFLAHLSGVATRTREFVEKVKNTQANILDTRKTTPGLRLFEKYAVATGGGMNHRMGLYDQALIKDNHLRILRKEPIASAVSRLKSSVLKRTIIGVEVKNLMELKGALKAPVDYILLDNMKVEMVREAVNLRKRAQSKVLFEASGGITIDNVLDYAETGVERISVGALTHHALSIDISLDIVG
ncbi:MAG: nicotinate-nucleotide diphosphorylase (carboxylating) [Omnitrophica bacterium RIFCSPHIGHO2_02_FULL_51_18]|nr:MAG: nicotinate-nucleotide diphosphorylase (carboxylating) [Omnitrophica bacterium RIFCSPHIGHO2_02_FULL_51_18]